MCQEKDKLQEEVEELQQKLAQMTVAQEVQQPLALPAPVEQGAPAGEEEEEEEDPEEREFCNSSDEDSEESTASSRFPPKKRMKASEYAKLFKTQP